MSILTANQKPVRATADTWQHIVKRAIRDPFTLCEHLQLPSAWAEQAVAASRDFALFAPEPFVSRIQPGVTDDPLLRQLLPVSDEQIDDPRFGSDPVGDRNATIGNRLLQKYAGRVLLITTGACAIHCRYCFRREFPYQAAATGEDDWTAAARSISNDRSIEELILSGGDPLMLTDQRLESLVDTFDSIRHLRRLRIHTRMPVVIPQRVTDQLVAILHQTRLDVIVVIHANHPREIDRQVEDACHRLAASPAVLLNQSVLMSKINDDVETLVQLSQRLLQCGVLPYYLHQLDRVRGTTHFEVPIEKGRQLVAQMRDGLPGYAVPRYVQETAGQASKKVLA